MKVQFHFQKMIIKNLKFNIPDFFNRIEIFAFFYIISFCLPTKIAMVAYTGLIGVLFLKRDLKLRFSKIESYVYKTYVIFILFTFISFSFNWSSYSSRAYFIFLIFYFSPLAFFYFCSNIQEHNIHKVIIFLFGISLVNAGAGVFQFIVKRDWDLVIGLWEIVGRNEQTAVAAYGFYMMMFFCIYISFFLVKKKTERIPFWVFILLAVTLLGWVMPAVSHSYASFMFGLCLFIVLLKYVRVLTIIKVFAVLCLLSYCVIFLWSRMTSGNKLRSDVSAITSNFAKYVYHGNKLIPKWAKFEVFENIIFTIPESHPTVPIIGVGPGSFNSRPALLQLENKNNPNSIYGKPSFLSRKYIGVFWDRGIVEKSVLFEPCGQYSAILGELGWFGLILFIIIFYNIFRMFSKINEHNPPLLIKAVANGCIIFLFSMIPAFLINNYWEFLIIPTLYFCFAGCCVSWYKAQVENNRK